MVCEKTRSLRAHWVRRTSLVAVLVVSGAVAGAASDTSATVAAETQTSSATVEAGKDVVSTTRTMEAAPQTTVTAAVEPADEATTMTDTEAERAAQSLVAVAGVPVRTTRESRLGTAATLVPGPSVVLKGDSMTVTGGDTTETLAVKSGADLLLKLGIVSPRTAKPVPGTLEKEEATTPSQLFDETQIKRLLGDNPTVVYRAVADGTPLPDPMIIPWVRNAILLKERFEEAIQMLADQKVREGREALMAIEAEFPNTEYAVQARQILQKLRELSAAPPPTEAPKASTGAQERKVTVSPTPVEIRVDPNIRIGTIMVDARNPGENRVIINGQAYGLGQAVRGYLNHKIVGISDDSVTVEVEVSGQKRQITVQVRKPTSGL